MLHFKDSFETGDIRVVRHCIGSFGVNTYLIVCRKTKKAAVVDPGGEVPALTEAIRAEGAEVTHMLFTHAHIDHIYGAEALKAALPGARVAYHAREQIVVDSTPDMCRMFGVPLCQMPAQEMDLEKEPEFSIGALQVRTLLTPGHTPGSVCFYLAEHNICLTGDLLFKGSVGRTDFEGGSGTDLRASLDRILEVLPDDTKILPGHGKYTTMAEEKKGNFYLRVDRWR